MAKRLYRLALTFIILAVILTPTFGLSCSSNSYSGTTEPITIATMANAGDILIFIGDEQKYFLANGLNITLKTYDSGLAATNAMLGGEADLAYATEFVVVGKALQKNST